jgi:tellurite resistance protein TerC
VQSARHLIKENFWILFNSFILIFVTIDLLSLNKQEEKNRHNQAIFWSCFGIGVALVFSLLIGQIKGQEALYTFLGVYFLEKSLSIDNILVLTGLSLFLQKKHDANKFGQESSCFKYIFSFFSDSHSKACMQHKKSQGRRARYNFIYCLVVIEVMDAVFALDSIPAALALTQDSFLIYTSNCFAVLGLRSLYICLTLFLTGIPNLTRGLGIILTFIGCKIIFSIHFPPLIFLMLVVLILSITVYTPFFIKRE